MDTAAGILRVPHGDREGTGLAVWEAMDPDSLVSGSPVQRGWLCDEDPARGYLAGVWDCTAFVAHPGPYPDDEVMLLLEGTVAMRMPDGTEVTVGPGEVFVIPKGLDCQWVQPDYVRKVFMIVSDPVAEGAANPSLGRITTPELAPAAEAGPVETRRTWYRNATGRMTVDVATHAGGRTVAAQAPEHLLVHVLAGCLTLEADGAPTRLSAGETAYVRAGTAVATHHEPGTRTLEARYRP